MKKSQWFFVVSVIIMMAMVLGACAPSAAPAAQPAPAESAATEVAAAATEAAPAASDAGKKVLRVAYHQENDTLNPFTSQMTGEDTIPMFDGLVMSSNEGKYVPVLAKEIPTKENGGIKELPDGKIEMTWKLQEGVKWHDGVEFTGEDICFTWQWLISDGAVDVYNQGDYKLITDCKNPDKNTVVFTWSVPFAPYATLFDSVLPKHLLEGKDIAKYDDYNTKPVGTGAYKFAEWKAGQYIRLVKNTDYWRKGYPKFDELIFYFIPDQNTRLNGMKAGEYDIAEISSSQAKEAATIPGYKVEQFNQFSWSHYGFSIKSETGKKLFSDVKVRQALFHAVDRQALIDGIMEGTVTLANSPMTPESSYYNPNVPAYDYDVEKAKKLLDEAGWVVGSDGIREKDGVKFSFTFLGRASRPQRLQMAEAIQAMYKEIGVDVQIKTEEDKAWTESWVSGNWDAVIGGWILPGVPSLTGLFACKGSNNMTGFCNPELDKVMEEADRTLDFAARKVLMDKAQEMLAADAFDLPLYYNSNPILHTDKLLNFKASGTNLGSYWNIYEWDFAQ